MKYRQLPRGFRRFRVHAIGRRIGSSHFTLGLPNYVEFWLKLILLLTLMFGYSVRDARAHAGGVPQLSNAEAGPYRISVWTQPDPLRVGRIDIVVAVAEPPAPNAAVEGAGALVLDAVVKIELKPVGQAGETLTALATHEASTNKLFYEAILELPAEGRWQVNIAVEGTDGSGSAGFEVQALPPLGFNWFLLGGFGLVLLATGWIIIRSKTPGNGTLEHKNLE